MTPSLKFDAACADTATPGAKRSVQEFGFSASGGTAIPS